MDYWGVSVQLWKKSKVNWFATLFSRLKSNCECLGFYENEDKWIEKNHNNKYSKKWILQNIGRYTTKNNSENMNEHICQNPKLYWFGRETKKLLRNKLYSLLYI